MCVLYVCVYLCMCVLCVWLALKQWVSTCLPPLSYIVCLQQLPKLGLQQVNRLGLNLKNNFRMQLAPPTPNHWSCAHRSIHPHTHTHTYTYTCTHKHTQIHTHTKHTHIYIHIYTYKHIHTHKHTHIHTNTQNTFLPQFYAACKKTTIVLEKEHCILER